ncbi:uncharacterized protein METZ01_LOCUS398683, partial [marine metagenome]
CSGIIYMRTTREATTVLYNSDEEFLVGGSRVVRSSSQDDVTVVGAGITLHESLEAADQLEADGVIARVIDLYSIKPIDVETLLKAAKETGLIVTVEDHRPEGGLGDAVLAVFATEDCKPYVLKLAVNEMPTSGKPSELLSAAGIDASHIADAVRKLIATNRTKRLS